MREGRSALIGKTGGLAGVKDDVVGGRGVGEMGWEVVVAMASGGGGGGEREEEEEEGEEREEGEGSHGEEKESGFGNGEREWGRNCRKQSNQLA